MAVRLIADTYRLADEVLYPAAAEVDRTGVIPPSHWSALADAGLFGIAAPVEVGGPGLALTQIIELQEVLASGCLPTAFTWLQHHGVVTGLATTDNLALRDALLADLTSGRRRAGVAYAGVVPTPPRMTAGRTADRWLVNGHAPFVSGWGSVDVLQISARDTDTDDVISAIIPARPPVEHIFAAPVDLAVCDATRTAFLRVDDLPVTDEQVVRRQTLADFFANQNTGLRINGALPFGIVRRATALLDQAGHSHPARALRERAGEIRARLDGSLDDAEVLLDARADGAALAVDAAATLIAAEGGRALLRGAPAQQLAREAAFTLVAASRPQLKDLLVRRFSGQHQFRHR
ncbi:MAG: acyl-CoA dehydrogenase family protein [Gordonia sp. (in: high G+C Gram-positive bacteria)]